MDKKYTDVKSVERGAKEASWIVGNKWTWPSSGPDIVSGRWLPTFRRSTSSQWVYALRMQVAGFCWTLVATY